LFVSLADSVGVPIKTYHDSTVLISDVFVKG
jgi:hypothetical protein